MSWCLSSFLSRFPAAKASATSLTRMCLERRGEERSMTRRSRAETREAETLLASHEGSRKNLRPSVQPPAGTGRLAASIKQSADKARASGIPDVAGRRNPRGSARQGRRFSRQPALNRNVRSHRVEPRRQRSPTAPITAPPPRIPALCHQRSGQAAERVSADRQQIFEAAIDELSGCSEGGRQGKLSARRSAQLVWATILSTVSGKKSGAAWRLPNIMSYWISRKSRIAGSISF